MTPLNPLAPYFPDFLSFLIFGLVTGYFLKIWKVAKRNIIALLFFLYCSLVWIASMALLMVIQTQERKIWFAVGFALTFVKLFQIVRYPFVYAFESIADTLDERHYQRQARKYQRKRERDNWEYQEERTGDRRGGGDSWSFQEEQARRAEEMRNYRNKAGQGEEQKQERKNDQNRGTGEQHQERDKIEDKRKKQQHQERQETKTERDTRNYEEILGLQVGWTQDDLKKAYQRECQRLHPDKWIGKPKSIRDEVEEEYKKVQEAYKKLKR